MERMSQMLVAIFLFMAGLQASYGLYVGHRSSQVMGFSLKSSNGGGLKELSTLTVPQLKDRLRELGLPVSGVKAELISRVQDGLMRADMTPQSPAIMSASSPSVLASSKKIKASKQTSLDDVEATGDKKDQSVSAVHIDIASDEYEDELDLIMSIGEKVLKEKNLGDLYTPESRRIIDANNHRTVTSAGPAPASGPDPVRDAIEKLLRARAMARKDKDYDLADKIRNELETMFRVSLFDRDGRWQDKEGRVGYYQQLSKAPTVSPVASAVSLSKKDVQELVDGRTKARRMRNFQLADEIRQKLADAGIELYDKLNSWQSLDGRMEGKQSEDGGFKSRWEEQI